MILLFLLIGEFIAFSITWMSALFREGLELV